MQCTFLFLFVCFCNAFSKYDTNDFLYITLYLISTKKRVEINFFKTYQTFSEQELHDNVYNKQFLNIFINKITFNETMILQCIYIILSTYYQEYVYNTIIVISILYSCL